MNFGHCKTYLMLLAVGALSAGSADAGEAMISKNPFSRPDSQTHIQVGATVNARGNDTRGLPNLTAVLIGEKHRYAVVSGRTVSLGEWVGDYRLIRVTEKAATFLFNGERLEVALRPESTQEENE